MGNRYVLTALSALTLWATYPPLGLSLLLPVALTPFWLACLRSKGPKQALLPGLVAGLCFGILSVHWLRFTHPLGYLGWIALAAYLATYWAASAALGSALQRAHWAAWPFIAAAAWVGLEYLRAYLLGGFPWFYLPHSWYRFPWAIQSVSWVGTYGLSFLLAFCSACLAQVIFRVSSRAAWRGPVALATGALGLLLVQAVAGWFVLAEAPPPEEGPQVALVQTNVPQHVKSHPDEAARLHRSFLETAERLKELNVDLVVWPETTWRHLWIEPADGLDARRLRELTGVTPEAFLRYRELVASEVQELARRAGAPTLLGLNVQVLRTTGRATYNSALLIYPDGRYEPPYHKVVLVPFGEYVPLERWLPWLRWLSPNTREAGSLTAGKELRSFTVEGYSFGVLICFEDTLPWLARQYVREQKVDFFVNLTNDGWFGPSVQHEVHLAIATFRSIECGRAMVRAVNTGISAIIDAYGRLVALPGDQPSDGVWKEAVVRGRVPIHRRRTPYVAWVGDLAGLACLAITAAVAAFCVVESAMRRGWKA